MVVEGIIIYKVADYKAAVKLARDTYTTVFGASPLCVALPPGVDPAGLDLDGLAVSRHPASLGTVQALGEIVRPVIVKSNPQGEGNGHGPTEPAPEPEPEPPPEPEPEPAPPPPAPPRRAHVARWGCSARCGDWTAWGLDLGWCPTCGAKLERIEL